MRVTTIVGTDKGAFVLRSDEARAGWTIEGPLFKGWKVTASARGASGRFIVATASQVYGPALHASDDLKTFRPIEHGPAWPSATGRALNQIWTIVAAPNRWYAGVDEAGLFASDDDGETWTPVEGLNEHPTRRGWVPGAGGLCAHAILFDPGDPARVWCGISAVGVFRTDDGGATWTPRNEGVPVVLADESCKDIGRCVHGLVADPDDANLIYRREHVGMFRSRDGGDHWERIENGLASWFGFPIDMDRRTRALFCVPLESDEYRMPSDGRLEVYRSLDGGDSWSSASRGLPTHPCYAGVLRGAMSTDQLDPCGVTFGTTAGLVYTSRDGADSWETIPAVFPRVLSVQSFVDR